MGLSNCRRTLTSQLIAFGKLSSGVKGTCTTGFKEFSLDGETDTGVEGAKDIVLQFLGKSQSADGIAESTEYGDFTIEGLPGNLFSDMNGTIANCFKGLRLDAEDGTSYPDDTEGNRTRWSYLIGFGPLGTNASGSPWR